MAEFTDLTLNKEVEEMEPEEARETLSDFMDSHEENRTAYDELNEEIDEVETEYKQKLEERDERISEFKEQRAEEAAEHVKMPADVLADRFTFEELDQIIEEATEFSEEEENENEDEDENLTTFSEKPEKGKRESGSFADTEHARDKLTQHGFISGGN